VTVVGGKPGLTERRQQRGAASNGVAVFMSILLYDVVTRQLTRIALLVIVHDNVASVG
jgi:hypothetical protein